MDNLDLFDSNSIQKEAHSNDLKVESDWLEEVLSNPNLMPSDDENLHTKELDYKPARYRVSSDSINEVKSILDKMVKIAEKKGFPKMHYTASNDFLLTDESNPDALTCISVVDIEVHFPAFGLGDYVVLAKLDHVSSAIPLVSHVSDFDGIPQRFLQPGCPPNCDHCSQSRTRNITWLLKHNDTGLVSQIGSSCISEFTRYNSPDAFLQYYDLLVSDLPLVISAFDPFYEEGGGARVANHATTQIILATALSVMHREGSGYISTSKADELGILSTTDLVRNSLFGKQKLISKLKLAPFFEEADRIIEWEKKVGIPENIKNSQYGHNQRALMLSGGADEKKLGIIVSLVAFYNSHLEEKKRLETQGVSAHQGQQNEKINRTLSCISQFENSSKWGISTTKIYTDPDGNIYKYTSGSHNYYALKHAPYEAKMTVKGHEEYKGTMQTVITRVAFPVIDAFESFCECKDPKKIEKLLSSIPHDLQIKNLDGKASHWFPVFFESKGGARSRFDSTCLIAEKLNQIFTHPAHIPYIDSYVSGTEDLLDYLLLLKADNEVLINLITTVRNSGGTFQIEKAEGGVNNKNILESVRSLAPRFLMEEMLDTQRYLNALNRYYEAVPTFSDSFIAAVAEFAKDVNRRSMGAIYNSNFFIDEANRLAFISSSNHEKATVIFSDGDCSHVEEYVFDENCALYLEKPKEKISSNERNHFALIQHNKQSVQNYSLENGIACIHAGSSGSFGSGFS